MMNDSWIPSHLQITVQQGRDLALKSRNANSEVYVNIQLDKEKVSTTFLPRHTHPIWNQTFEIPLMSLQSTLEIQIRQKSKFSDEYIGQIHLPVTNLLSKKLRKNWHKLSAKPGKANNKIRGDILITTCCLSKWDSKETETNLFDNIDIDEQVGMLRRTKSEYRSKSKGYPKNDKIKQKSVFDRLRKNKGNVFEECEDFVVSVRSPDSPPTPVNCERKQLMTSSLSNDINGDLPVSSPPNVSSDFKEMFTEATNLEKSGVLDLSRVDATTRLELGRQMFESTRYEEDFERNDEEMNMSPILRTYSFRHKRPLRTQSLSIKTNNLLDKTLPNESLHKSLSTTTDSSTAQTTVTSPQTVTYRATAMKRRGKRNNNGGSNQGSTASVDSDSMTSEYYSSTSLSENTIKTSSTLSVGREEDSVIDKIQDESITNNNSSISLQITEVDGNSQLLKKEERLSKTDNEINHERLLGATLTKEMARREMSVPTETQTLQRDEVRMRKVRKRFASETLDNKRHSADIESLLRLTASQGRNDGLGNVLNTQQVKMKLKRQSTLQDYSPTHPNHSSTSDHVSVTRSANSTPPCIIIKGNDEILLNPTDSETISQDIITGNSIDQNNVRSQNSEPKLTIEQLPSITRTYHNADTRPDLITSLKLGLAQHDKATLFDSEGSSSTGSALYPLSSIPTSLDSSFSSDYAYLSNNLKIDDDNPSDVTTPTSVTPIATREGTPSPDLQQPLLLKEEHKFEDLPKKSRHSYNKSHLDFSRGDMPPLPPSLQYPPSLSTSHGKYASALNMTNLVSAAVKVLKPYENHQQQDNLPTNIRNTCTTKYSSTVQYSLSANNSGRTSPVIEENEPEESDTSLQNIVTASCDTLCPNNDHSPNDKKQLLDTTPVTKQTRDTGPVPIGNRKLPSITNFDSNSLQRRKQQGSSSGLRKALSMYQDNKRQSTAGARRALYRGTSIDDSTQSSITNTQQVALTKPKTEKRQLPKIPTTKPSEATPSKLIDQQTKTSDSNGDIPSNHSGGSHFDLPPPPKVNHTTVAEQVCGISQSDDSPPQDDNISTNNESEWKSSQSTLGTSSSDECEELSEDSLQGLNKQELIALVLQMNARLIKSKRRFEDTQSYLDSLLLKVMEKHPELLGAGL